MEPIEPVVVDLIYKGQKLPRRQGELRVTTVKHGRWEINKVSGKVLCLIELRVPSFDIKWNFPPTHGFCEKFIDKMLECEWENDKFKFSKPAIEDYRPTQLNSKIERLQQILNKWREKARSLEP